MNPAAITLDMPIEATEAAVPERKSFVRRLCLGLFSAVDWCFGLFSLVVGLAIFSVIPVLNFLSLGYLLHVSGQVATTGKLRSGFVGVRKASVLGSFIIGTWLVCLPVRFAAGMWRDAELLNPGGASAGGWQVAVVILAAVTVLHIVWACLRGGRLRHFVWPAPIKFVKWLNQPNKLQPIRRSVVSYLASLRLPYYFWLGARGFFGAFLWLLVPVGFLIFASTLPAGAGFLFSFIGGLILMTVVCYLPFLQTHFVLTNRFGALFEVRQVQQMFNRAPIAFWTSLFITLLFSLPLYLLKIELPPREVAWFPSLFFVLFIFPARMLVGWAVSRARRRKSPRHFVFRWSSRLALIPVVFFYVFFVYLTQYLSWNGSLSLLDQHAFMVPAPLMSL